MLTKTKPLYIWLHNTRYVYEASEMLIGSVLAVSDFLLAQCARPARSIELMNSKFKLAVTKSYLTVIEFVTVWRCSCFAFQDKGT